MNTRALIAAFSSVFLCTALSAQRVVLHEVVDGQVRVRVLELGISKIEPLDILNDVELQRDIECVPEQTKMLKEIWAEIVARDPETNFNDTPKEAQKIKRLAKLKEIYADAMKKLEAVLLPHQHSALREIQFRKQFESQGTKGVLLNKFMNDELGLTQTQEEKIQDRILELEQEIAEKVKELKRGALKDVLTLLDEEQRARFDKLSGGKLLDQIK